MASWQADLDNLRQERRQLAATMRGEGHSLRDIAEQLGITHPTVLADLRATGHTDPEISHTDAAHIADTITGNSHTNTGDPAETPTQLADRLIREG